MPTLFVAALLGLALAAPAAAEAPSLPYAAWQDCLRQAFRLQAALSGRELAADTALRDCRIQESAYLGALSVSPLLDGEDVARARPALRAGARTRLLARAP